MVGKKFDYIIGNPPYQNPNEKVDNSVKLYAKITKRILNKSDVIAFVTPISLVKPGKRELLDFSRIKIVDYSADGYFNVGVTICWWLLDTQSHTKKKIIQRDGSIYYSQGTLQKDDEIKRQFFERVEKIRSPQFKDITAPTVPDGRYTFLNNHFRDRWIRTDRESEFKHNRKLVILASRGFKNNVTEIPAGIDVQGMQMSIDNLSPTQIQNMRDFFELDIVNSIAKCYRDYHKTGFFTLLPNFPFIDPNKKHTTKDVIDMFKMTPDEVKMLKQYEK